MLNVHQWEGSAVEACDDATSDASRACPLNRLEEASNGRGGSPVGWSRGRKVVVDVCGDGGSCRAHAIERVRRVQNSLKESGLYERLMAATLSERSHDAG